jgi:anti-sigma regulatory factor (Ser/Thr protein kinase)
MPATADGARALCLVRDAALRRTLRRTLHAAGSTAEFVDDRLPDDSGPPPALVFVDSEARRGLADQLARWPTSSVVVLGDSLDDDGVLDLLRRTATHVIADADEAELVATSVKVLTGDLFGIDKYLTWGARTDERAIADYTDKRAAVRAVAEFARQAGARRTLIARIESAVDELLMNALYDAPGDDGEPFHATLRYGADGRVLAVSVEDRYGALARDHIVDHVTRARRERGRPRDTDDGGAGLGLYFVVAHATRIVANIEPGRRTEMICLFDLREHGRDAAGCARSLHVFGV